MMSIFQIAALAVLAMLAGLNVKQILNRQGRALLSAAWLVLWATGAALVVHPELARGLARLVGIGRGADLIFYCNVLVTLGGIFVLWQRNRAMEQRITVLTRQLALATAMGPTAEKDGPSVVTGAG